MMLLLKKGSESLNQLQVSRLVVNKTGPTKAWLPLNSKDTWNIGMEGNESIIESPTCAIRLNYNSLYLSSG